MNGWSGCLWRSCWWRSCLLKSTKVSFLLRDLHLQLQEAIGELVDLSQVLPEDLVRGLQGGPMGQLFFFDACEFLSSHTLIVLELKQALWNSRMVIHIAIAVAAVVVS